MVVVRDDKSSLLICISLDKGTERGGEGGRGVDSERDGYVIEGGNGPYRVEG